MSWRNKPVFVSGATGFIGGRVCERLLQAGVGQVQGLVHHFGRAARISRLPISLCAGDLLDRRSLRRALGDSKMVIHLGLGHGPGIVRGTKNLLQVAREARVERFVHISTTGVYGLRPVPGCETEEAPARQTGNVYCDNKLRAEQLAVRFARKGLPVTVLRPAIVYGPYSRWCIRTVQGLREGKIALIDGGSGTCNTTYVDNLVDAIFLALQKPEAIGEIFSITDGEAVRWKDFIRAHAEMVDPALQIPEVTSEQVLAYHRNQPGFWTSSFSEARRILASPEFRNMLKRIPACDRLLQRLWYSLQNFDEEKKMQLRIRLAGSLAAPYSGRNGFPMPDLDTWAIQTGTVYFQIDKVRRILGYEPRVSFREGIRLTEQWLRFANYV